MNEEIITNTGNEEVAQPVNTKELAKQHLEGILAAFKDYEQFYLKVSQEDRKLVTKEMEKFMSAFAIQQAKFRVSLMELELETEEAEKDDNAPRTIGFVH